MTGRFLYLLAASAILAALLVPLGPAPAGFGGQALAASALSPRHSGLEPPGGPRPLEGLPAKSAGRTAEGGMGYTDAYGNTIDDLPREEKAPRQRPRPGAYGGPALQQDSRPLPDPRKSETPAWSFK